MTEIKLYTKQGRPVLVGTTSVERSEALAAMLQQEGGSFQNTPRAGSPPRSISVYCAACARWPENLKIVLPQIGCQRLACLFEQLQRSTTAAAQRIEPPDVRLQASSTSC